MAVSLFRDSKFAGAAARQPPLAIKEIPHEMGEADAAAILNRTLCFVHDFNGQPSVVQFMLDGAVRRIALKELREMLANRRVRLGSNDDQPKFIQLVTFWMLSKQRLEFGRAIYDPEGLIALPGEKVLNLYAGFSRSTRPGHWDLMMAHLYCVVCGSNEALFWYLIKWLAHAVQHPGTSPGTVIVLRSRKEGTGKTTVAEWLHAMFGRHSMMLNTPEQLIGQFGEHLECISFICVNEPTFPGDHAGARKFKSMITESEWVLEPKGRKIYRVANVAHILLTTNELWVVPAGSGARRFVMFDVDERRAGDHAYFAALRHQANSGGIEAMLHALLAVDLTDFDVRDIPVTSALIEQQQLSASAEVQWALDLAEDGGHLFGTTVSSRDLYELYETHAKTMGTRHPLTKIGFGKWLSSLGLRPAQTDPPSFQWTPMLAFRSWRGVSDEYDASGFPGVFQTRSGGPRGCERPVGGRGGPRAGPARDGASTMDDAVRGAGDGGGVALQHAGAGPVAV